MATKYISSPSHWKTMFTQHGRIWEAVDKCPISRIKINPRFFSFRNEVDPKQVDYIVDDFDRELWIPIRVNEKFYLLDGQHRLQAAKRMGLKYIDVIVEHNQ